MSKLWDEQKVNKDRKKQIRYLSQAIQLEEAVNPHVIGATMMMVSMAVIVFLVWAGFTNIHEVARTPGEVVPFGYQRTVQHLEGGIIKTINVHEGEVVEEGQILLRLSDAGIKEDLERARSKQLFLEMQAERLQAFIEGRVPVFANFTGATGQMVESQQASFEGMRMAREKEAKVTKDQVMQKKQALISLEADLGTAEKNRRLMNDVYKRRQALNKKGYASDIQILEEEQRINQIDGEIKRMRNQIDVAKTEIEEFEARLESLSARHRDEAYMQLDKVLADKEQNIKIIRKLEERIGRMAITAPAHGLVKGLAVNTIGAVVQPGQTIMEIVPLDETLEVQVKISPQDIGHLQHGQHVQVKFSTYDFSRYGSVRGQLDRISATTFTGENGERFYQGRIVLSQNYVGSDPSNIILPGMTVMADIITGDKTILQYMLKPIHTSLKTALTER